MAPTRRFGQNFLISQKVRERIIELLELEGAENTWEIGPGLGAMTSHLVHSGSRLTLFEIDRRFIDYLEQIYGNNERVRIVSGDVVKTWTRVYEEEGAPDRIIGNLPYNSAAAIIASFIEQGNIPSRMVYTVQKEVGERMLAAPGSRDYSSFTVLCAFACTVQDCGNVAPGNFYPRPHVVSKVVRMVPHTRYDLELLPIVSSFTRAVFASRRKTIRNNLARSSWRQTVGLTELLRLLKDAGINPEDRGENLSVGSIVRFAEIVKQSNMQV